VVLAHCQLHKISTLGSLPPAEGGTNRWGKKNARCQNQTGLLQHSIRCTQINPGLILDSQGGSREHPRAPTLTMRSKLARSCWSDTMTGKSLRKTGTEREEGGVAQESLLLASPQQGVSPSRSIQQGAGGSWSQLRQASAGLALSCTDLGSGEVSLHGCQKCCSPVSRVLDSTSQRIGS
jgi:hypothetical protein